MKLRYFSINGTKTVGAGLAIASTVCCFAVPPVGIALGIASAGTGVASGGADWLTRQVQDRDFRDLAREHQEAMQKLEECTDSALAAVAALSASDLIWLQESMSAGSMPLFSYSTVTGAVKLDKLATLILGLKATEGIGDATVRADSPASSSASRRVFGISSMGVVEGGQATAKVLLPITGNVLSGFGAAFSVGTAIYGWLEKVPTQKQVSDVIANIEDILPELERLCSQ